MKHISHSFFRGFRRLSARSGSGSGPGRCFPVFPKGPAPAAQRGLWHPSGLWPDGCQGLCSKVASHRENDSLHFVRRSAPSKCVRCASLRSGGRRLAVRTAMGNHIGAMPRTPFPAAREFPSRGNERYEEKNRESYTSCTTPAFPLWWLAPPPSPHSVVGLWMLSHGAMSRQESIERFILSPGWGKVRRSRIRGSRAAANYQDVYHIT